MAPGDWMLIWATKMFNWMRLFHWVENEVFGLHSCGKQSSKYYCNLCVLSNIAVPHLVQSQTPQGSRLTSALLCCINNPQLGFSEPQNGRRGLGFGNPGPFPSGKLLQAWQYEFRCLLPLRLFLWTPSISPWLPLVPLLSSTNDSPMLEHPPPLQWMGESFLTGCGPRAAFYKPGSAGSGWASSLAVLVSRPIPFLTFPPWLSWPHRCCCPRQPKKNFEMQRGALSPKIRRPSLSSPSLFGTSPSLIFVLAEFYKVWIHGLLDVPRIVYWFM